MFNQYITKVKINHWKLTDHIQNHADLQTILNNILTRNAG